MSTIEQLPSLIYEDTIMEGYPYAPSVGEARTTAVLLSAAYVLQGVHDTVVLPCAAKEDVLLADDRYAATLQLLNAQPEKLEEEYKKRMHIWEMLDTPLDQDQTLRSIGNIATQSIIEYEYIKPTVLRQLSIERNIALNSFGR